MSITDRLNEFVKNKYGDKHGYKSLFAKDLEISPGQAAQYLSGERIPGNKIHQKLRNIGCDIEWLMTGEHQMMTNEEMIAMAFSRKGNESVELTGNVLESSYWNNELHFIETLKLKIANLEEEVARKNEELADKRKIIALLEDKLLTIALPVGNEKSSIEFPKQVLQKIK